MGPYWCRSFCCMLGNFFFLGLSGWFRDNIIGFCGYWCRTCLMRNVYMVRGQKITPKWDIKLLRVTFNSCAPDYQQKNTETMADVVYMLRVGKCSASSLTHPYNVKLENRISCCCCKLQKGPKCRKKDVLTLAEWESFSKSKQNVWIRKTFSNI